VLAENGSVEAVAGSSRDITERERMQAAQCASEKRLRALITASSDVLYRMSPDWTEMRQLGGGGFIPDAQSPNTEWLRDYIHPDDQPAVWAATQTAVRTKGIFELEHRVLHVDGTLGRTTRVPFRF
jgi:PAS domain-containing protein